MSIISRRVNFQRTTGFYGHFPTFYKRRVAYVGYVRLVTKNNLYTFWYMGNPYRHKIFEKFPNYARRWIRDSAL